MPFYSEIAGILLYNRRMNRDIFRKSALDKIASLDQLDQSMTVIKPASVLTAVCVALVIGVALFWGFMGSVPEVVKGNGVFVNSENIFSEKYGSQGTIKNVFVRRGDTVESGQVIARVERQDLLDQIKNNEKKLDGLIKMKQLVVESNKHGSFSAGALRNLYERGLITQQEYYNSRQTEVNLDGQITEAKQQLAISRENYETATQVVSDYSGTVIEVPVRKGDYVQAGTTIIVVQTEARNNTVEALLYFQATDGKKIEPGMKIGLIPSTVKQEEYGYILGIVRDVSEFPVSDAYLSSRLQNSALANSFHEIKNPIEVTVSLMPDIENYSGYKWSSSKGPRQKIGAGYMCSATVTTSRKRPVDLIVPALKKKLWGIGE